MRTTKRLLRVLALMAATAASANAQAPYSAGQYQPAGYGPAPARSAGYMSLAPVGACTEDCIGLPPGMPAPSDQLPPEPYDTPLPQQPGAADSLPNFAPAQGAPSGPLLAASFGAASGTRGNSPNMIGDFFAVPSATFAIQAPDQMINLGSTTIVRELGVMGVPGLSRFDNVLGGGQVEFQIDSVGGTLLNNTVFRSLDPLDGITATTGDVFELEIGGANNVNNAQALTEFINARINDPEVQAAFEAQKEAAIAASGGGSFDNTLTAADGTLTIDFTGAVLTTVTTDPGDSDVTNFSGSATGTVDPSSTFLIDQQFTFTGPTVVFTPAPIILNVSTPGGGALLGRGKLSDNNSPMPRDRIFLDYNQFQSAALTSSGVDVHRLTPGFEKTFFNGNASVEVRLPMGSTLDNRMIADGVTDMQAEEFGDVNVAFKGLLWTDYQTSIAAGVGFSVPTAADVSVDLANGTQLVAIRNESVHVKPFIAALREQGPYFAQAWIIVDVDANGNPVMLNETGAGLVDSGVLQSQTLLQFDAMAGAWLMRNESSTARLNGLAATAEIHATSAVSDLDMVDSTMFTVVDPNNDFDVVNVTLGGHAVMGKTVVTVGFTFPVTQDQSFDSEFRTFINRYF